MAIINEKYLATSTDDQINVWNFIECSLENSIQFTNTVKIMKIINVYLVSYSSDAQISIYETQARSVNSLIGVAKIFLNNIFI